MIGVDANVLLSLLTQDDPRLTAVARRFVDKLEPESPGHVSVVALCEIVWTLQRRFGLDRAEVTLVVQRLLNATELHLERAEAVEMALAGFADGGPGFNDHLIAAMHLMDGIRSTVTFDRKASRLPGWRLLTDA